MAENLASPHNSMNLALGEQNPHPSLQLEAIGGNVFVEKGKAGWCVC